RPRPAHWASSHAWPTTRPRPAHWASSHAWPTTRPRPPHWPFSYAWTLPPPLPDRTAFLHACPPTRPLLLPLRVLSVCEDCRCLLQGRLLQFSQRLPTGPEDCTYLLPLVTRELKLRVDLRVPKGAEASDPTSKLLKAFALWCHM